MAKKKETKQSPMQRLFVYAGKYKYLTIASWILAAISAFVALVPFYFIWRIIKEVLYVAPNYADAENLSAYGWSAVGFAILSMLIYIGALICSHLSAFRVQANIRVGLMKHILTLPLGFMDEEGSGKVRKVVNESSAATETYLAHQLPDKAGAIATPIGLLALLFLFDWRLGLLSLAPVVLGFLIMINMTGAKMKKKMEEYQNVLSSTELEKIDKYFRAANYLSVGQLYLRVNPLLRSPLKFSDIKKNIVGHWGTVPGQTFIYTHLNRIIKKYDLNMIYLSGPGHGGNSVVSEVYLEGTYSEIYPNITEDIEGMKKLFKQFSFPGGISSHVAPETPGSIHEGGELGYSLAHAFGAVLDNPDLIATCVVGDGEAETGPLATSWHYNKFLNPKTDGAIIPILHLNGYKIANPTIFARISEEELLSFFKGCGYEPFVVSGDDPLVMHQKMAYTLDKVVEKIKNENLNRDIIYSHIINNDFNFDQETLNKCGYNFIRSIEYLIELINEKDNLFLCCNRDNKFYTNHYLIDNLSDIIYNEEYQKALKLENIEPNLNQWTKFLYRN